MTDFQITTLRRPCFKRMAFGRRSVTKYLANNRIDQSKAVSSADELVKGGGWAPDGYGILTQKITLAADGNSFESGITLELSTRMEKSWQSEAEASGSGKRLGF